MNDEIQQKAEWRARLIGGVLSNTHDDETRVAMFEAGLHQAHSEGLHDAIYVIEKVAVERPDYAAALGIIAKSLRKLDRLNAQSADTAALGEPETAIK